MLGYIILVGALAVKVPQILKIWKAKSAFGLSPETTYIEIIYYIPIVGYNLFRNNPISTFGETIAVMVQTFMILMLIWSFDKNISG